MKDFLGQPLEVGDRVVFLEAHYRSFKKGIVAAFTPQKVRVSYPSPFKSRAGQLEDTLRYPSEVVRAPA